MAGEIPPDILAFLTRHIDSVPALEALLLLWDDRGRTWPLVELAGRIYLPQAAAQQILRHLEARQFVEVVAPEQYRYAAHGTDADALVARLAETYRSHLIPIATFLHAKAPAPVREFARAFDLKKDS